MKRTLFAAVIVTLALLAGCVVTPAYRYHGGVGGYYYSQPYRDSTVIYGNAGAWYPYDSYYYGGWGAYPGARVYIQGRNGYDRDDYRHDRHRRHDRRFATRFRQAATSQQGSRRGSPRLAPRTRQATRQPARRATRHTSHRRSHQDKRRSWRRTSRSDSSR